MILYDLLYKVVFTMSNKGILITRNKYSDNGTQNVILQTKSVSDVSKW